MTLLSLIMCQYCHFQFVTMTPHVQELMNEDLNKGIIHKIKDKVRIYEVSQKGIFFTTWQPMINLLE